MLRLMIERGPAPLWDTVESGEAGGREITKPGTQTWRSGIQPGKPGTHQLEHEYIYGGKLQSFSKTKNGGAGRKRRE